MPQRQINIRIEEGEFEVLAAAAFLDDESPPDVVRAFIEARVEELKSDPEVLQALQAKRVRDKRKEGEQEQAVSSLDEKRKRRRGRDA